MHLESLRDKDENELERNWGVVATRCYATEVLDRLPSSRLRDLDSWKRSKKARKQWAK